MKLPNARLTVCRSQLSRDRRTGIAHWLNRMVLLALIPISIGDLSAQESETSDPRAGELRTLNSHFPFRPPSSLEAWHDRSVKIRRDLRMALGLTPPPTRTPLHPVVHGRIDMGEYTIEKVYFQSMPGFYVTGNLYRPKSTECRMPGVLCPHGHHRDGRFRKATEAEIDEQIRIGAESFRNNARSPLQARCVHLAKMGCVVFHYDMIGYADSQQIPYEIAHGFSRQRPELNSEQRWGLFSPRAETLGQSVMALQTWNSIRALEFLTSLPDVDSNRIGVTGASGGGTQTFILCAVDDRPHVAFPAVMVSTAMQGGCTCENCCYLRINAGNVDFAALFAPKPLGLTAADDWTRDMPSDGFPQLQQLYHLFGAADDVTLTARLEFGHNYNQVSREAMYRWFARHLDLSGPTVETEIQFLEPEQLTVFDDEHARPPGGVDFEVKLLKQWADDVRQQVIPAQAADEQLRFASHERRNRWVRDFVDMAIGPVGPNTDRATRCIESARPSPTSPKGLVRIEFRLTNDRGEIINVVAIGSEEKWAKRVNPAGRDAVVWIGDDGSRVLQPDHPDHRHVQSILDTGCAVYLVDHTFWSGGAAPVRLVPNNRDFAGYTFGYNAPIPAARAQDFCGLILTRETLPFGLPGHLACRDPSSLGTALLTAIRCQGVLSSVMCDTKGERFGQVRSIDSPSFLPGAARFGDVPAFFVAIEECPVFVDGTATAEIRVLQRQWDKKTADSNDNSTGIHFGDDEKSAWDRWLEALKR